MSNTPKKSNKKNKNKSNGAEVKVISEVCSDFFKEY